MEPEEPEGGAEDPWTPDEDAILEEEENDDVVDRKKHFTQTETKLSVIFLSFLPFLCLSSPDRLQGGREHRLLLDRRLTVGELSEGKRETLLFS